MYIIFKHYFHNTYKLYKICLSRTRYIFFKNALKSVAKFKRYGIDECDIFCRFDGPRV